MRIIKFRFWDTERKKYLTDVTFADRRIPSNWQQFYIPQQFTGLLDKSGVEIYEGDIVYVKQNIYAQKHLTVEWGYDRWEFKEEFDNGDYYNGYAIHWEEVEVIGNIYENSDLLDKQT